MQKNVIRCQTPNKIIVAIIDKNYRRQHNIFYNLKVTYKIAWTHEKRNIVNYPRVPLPAMGGLGGFCVGGLVLDNVPPPARAGWLFPCWKHLTRTTTLRQLSQSWKYLIIQNANQFIKHTAWCKLQYVYSHIRLWKLTIMCITQHNKKVWCLEKKKNQGKDGSDTGPRKHCGLCAYLCFKPLSESIEKERR